jgi:hypothetical protein
MKRISLFIILFIIFVQILFSQHNPGKDCISCHSGFRLGGTVFLDTLGVKIASGVAVSLSPVTGSTITISNSNSSGNFYSSSVSSSSYIIKVGGVSSKTWHTLSTQKSCNTCHLVGGNGNSTRTLELPDNHTQVSSDNSCTSCHQSPARQYSQLKTHGVLTYTKSTAVNTLNNINSGESFTLYPPYPNPFNSTVNLLYRINEPGYLTISIYNITGQKIKSLFEGNISKTGQQLIKWEVNNIPSGIYFVLAKLGNTSLKKEVLYLK